MKERYRIILTNIQKGDYFISNSVCGKVAYRILRSDNVTLFDIRVNFNLLHRVVYNKDRHTILRMV